jgi:hypothetical protein
MPTFWPPYANWSGSERGRAVAAPRAPLFLERQTYRRRRLMDAARILPVAGLVGLLVPVLWSGDGQTSTASEAVYIFGLWLSRIVAALGLSRPLDAAIERETTPYSPPRPGGAANPVMPRDDMLVTPQSTTPPPAPDAGPDAAGQDASGPSGR